MAKRNANGLTDKWQQVADLYLADPQRVGWKAYQQVYKCSQRVAESRFSDLLKRSEFNAYVNKMTQEASEKVGVTVERTFEELARVGMFAWDDMFEDDGQLKHVKDMPAAARAAIAGVEVHVTTVGEDVTVAVHKIKLWDKNRALEMIGRHLKMFQNNEDKATDFLDLYNALVERKRNVGVGPGIAAPGGARDGLRPADTKH